MPSDRTSKELNLPRWDTSLIPGNWWTLSVLCWWDWIGTSTLVFWTVSESASTIVLILGTPPWSWPLHCAFIRLKQKHFCLLLCRRHGPSHRIRSELSKVRRFARIFRWLVRNLCCRSAFFRRPIYSSPLDLRRQLPRDRCDRWFWTIWSNRVDDGKVSFWAIQGAGKLAERLQ